MRFSTGLGVALGLAILAYLPFLPIPLISDDYVQIYLARQFGPVAGWAELAQDALYRCRATSLLFTYALDVWLGPDATAHRLLNVLVHLLGVALVALLGSWPRIGWRVSLPAAIFFAVQEGHQEAVVWSAALPELLVFVCGVGSLLCWSRGWRPAAFLLFVLALFSKESGVVVVPLLAWYWWREELAERRGAIWLGVMAAVAGVYAAAIFTASGHLHLGDGTFSSAAPVWKVLAVSLFRLLWVWGFAALALLAVYRAEGRVVLVSLGWMVITFLPYAFLTYMDRVPSRHTYWASAGLALLVGAAFAAVQERSRGRQRWLVAAFAGLILAQNLGYLWMKKVEQFQERAAVTERFLAEVERHSQPVELRCGAYGLDVYRFAVNIRLGSPVERVQPAGSPTLPAEHVDYCDPLHP